MASRKVWLDNLKMLAMLMVVVYHTPPRYDNAHEAALFNMGAPVFFFAAGYLFNIGKQRSFLSFLLHRARQLLVPYTSFFVAFYALWLNVGRRLAGGDEMAIGALVPLKQFVQGMPDVVLGTFWFIAALFTMQLIYYPIKRYLTGWWPFVVAMLLNLSFFVLPDIPWLRYWNLDKAMLYMPIYAFGNCMAFPSSSGRNGELLTSHTPLHLMAWVVLAAAGIGLLVWGPLHINREVAYILAPWAVIMTIPLYVAVSRWLEGSSALSRFAHVVAVTSITYLALQNYLIGVIKMLLARLLGESVFDDNILLKVCIALAVMAILYPISMLVDRYFPFMLGKRSSTLPRRMA